MEHKKNPNNWIEAHNKKIKDLGIEDESEKVITSN